VLLVASLDVPSVKNLKTVFRTMGLMAYPEAKLLIVMNRAGSKVGLELGDVEKHLGRSVKVGISSSIEVPRALNAGEVLLLAKPTNRVSQELAKLVRSFETSGNGSAAAGRSMFRR
jgi:pilus assembly protein CpaE